MTAIQMNYANQVSGDERLQADNDCVIAIIEEVLSKDKFKQLRNFLPFSTGSRNNALLLLYSLQVMYLQDLDSVYQLQEEVVRTAFYGVTNFFTDADKIGIALYHHLDELQKSYTFLTNKVIDKDRFAYGIKSVLEVISTQYPDQTCRAEFARYHTMVKQDQATHMEPLAQYLKE